MSGHVNVFTELPPCRSCSDVIRKQFSKLYPKVELRVYHDNGIVSVYKDGVVTEVPRKIPVLNPGEFPRAPGLLTPLVPKR